MKTRSAIFLNVAIYILMFIYTFGHSFNSKRADQMYDCNRVGSSLIEAITWPLYWSVYLQRP